jgi:hypothetical protein
MMVLLKFKENITDKIIYEYVLKPKILVLVGDMINYVFRRILFNEKNYVNKYFI